MGNGIFRLLTFKILLAVLLVSCSGAAIKKVSIIETSDVHGVILPYDFIEKKEIKSSLASVFSYIRQVRKEKDVTILLDDGDNLQGQPEVYYYNFIDTLSPHFQAEAMNYMGYDAQTAGNHDIETGHAVYDRIAGEYKFPLLAANAVNIKTGKPYFKPYKIIEKKGVRVAVLGLITPSVPDWLPPELYSGIEFRDMVETARIWMPVILKEKPDLVVGLFHSGWDKSRTAAGDDGPADENGSAAVAYNVPGFDIIFTGHDHKVANEKFVNNAGDTVLILNCGPRAEQIAQADIIFNSRRRKGKSRRTIEGSIVKSSDFKPDPGFVSSFARQDKVIGTYVNKVIARSSSTISSRDALFGPSAFVDMVHSLQLKITGADISFAAPLSFDVSILKGPVTVGDMFKLYKYENMLYTMTLSGGEIKKYLEYSYSGWFNTMRTPGDLMLNFRTGKDGKPVVNNGRAWLKNPSYDFDSAAGIDYTVDLKKKEGERVTIKGFTDGRPFLKNKIYRVAINSFRGNGGGGHLTGGAGIKKSELRSRLVSSTDRDLRYFIMKAIESEKIITPVSLNNWKILPENWVMKETPREYQLLFGKKK
jgi:2',3'-cyclic-nucleotide 2'-phosphodiesterase / 3'-nucleotidase